MKKKVAVPVSNGVLSPHFGHCEHFVIAEIDEGKVETISKVIPPPHEPGIIPRWLSEKGVNVVLVGGIGQKALNLFQQYGIEAVIGVSPKPPSELIEAFLAKELESGVSQCSH